MKKYKYSECSSSPQSWSRQNIIQLCWKYEFISLRTYWYFHYVKHALRYLLTTLIVLWYFCKLYNPQGYSVNKGWIFIYEFIIFVLCQVSSNRKWFVIQASFINAIFYNKINELNQLKDMKGNPLLYSTEWVTPNL